MIGPRTSVAMLWTAWKSPSLMTGKTGLDDIDVEAGQLTGDLHFLAEVHGRAGALFAVAQGGVEDDDFIRHGKKRNVGW